MPSKNGQNPSSIRINNTKLVLNVIRNSKEVTVAQISKEIKLSKTTIWKTFDYLLENQMILNIGKSASSEDGGKKPELYSFNENYGYVISIALYGSFILMTLNDAAARIFYKEKIFIRENKPLDTVIGIISSFVSKWQDPTQLPATYRDSLLLGVVLASSGVIDSQQGICMAASRFDAWPARTPIQKLITKQVDLKAPFFIDNYNRFIAYADKHLGGFEAYRNIVDVMVDKDGLGAGIIEIDRIKQGTRYLFGEIGHMCLNPFDDDTCRCGGKGCFEQLVSLERLTAKAASFRDQHPESALNFYERIDPQTIFACANQGDSLACELVSETAGWFALGFHNISLVLSPEVFIVSGDYTQAGDFFLQELIRKTKEISLVRVDKDSKIFYSSLGDEGCVLGGAYYMINDHFSNIFNNSKREKTAAKTTS